MFSPMRYQTGSLSLINQLLLPMKEEWLTAKTVEDVAIAIESMVVRGAPAIGCTAAWGVVLGAWAYLQGHPKSTWNDFESQFLADVSRLRRTRPTAVNLFYALNAMETCGAGLAKSLSIASVYDALAGCARLLQDDDLSTCKLIGGHGSRLFPSEVTILTHCNTGSLATAGYGTALGIVRALFEQKKLREVFVDETRPYLQGSRLTAFELKKDGIPHRLIADNMAASAMQRGWIDAVIVGADRISANGDTANKIGTFSLAVLANYHKIPFIVAAPTATVDLAIATGAEIEVEERPPSELLKIQGISIAPEGTSVWNPSFDITPAELISWIVTEKGAFKPQQLTRL